MPSGHGRNAGEVIDFCSIKASSVRGLCSFEGARKIDDIKRHVVVDTLGLLVAVLAAVTRILRFKMQIVGWISPGRPDPAHQWVAERTSPGCTAADALPASTS
jgi:hypothetical protein